MKESTKKHYPRFAYLPTIGEKVQFGPHETALIKKIFESGLKMILEESKKSYRYEIIVKWRNIKTLYKEKWFKDTYTHNVRLKHNQKKN